ncbi:hypothetical protein CK203_055481 [Vitis vinifera]|uniref:Uncharacterized protein n=1 Tax=Vitis vinifera TaxID=29760 RepID=A0A438FKQ0_VITVI|nr:hypothetical protein CK203_055481 [Vitis vinifera]
MSSSTGPLQEYPEVFPAPPVDPQERYLHLKMYNKEGDEEHHLLDGTQSRNLHKPYPAGALSAPPTTSVIHPRRPPTSPPYRIIGTSKPVPTPYTGIKPAPYHPPNYPPKPTAPVPTPYTGRGKPPPYYPPKSTTPNRREESSLRTWRESPGASGSRTKGGSQEPPNSGTKEGRQEPAGSGTKGGSQEPPNSGTKEGRQEPAGSGTKGGSQEPSSSVTQSSSSVGV